jgi:hypothetical protein
MEEISGDYVAGERMARRGTADGFDFPARVTRELRSLWPGDPLDLRGYASNNYRQSPRLRWKLQSIPPPRLNVPETC